MDQSGRPYAAQHLDERAVQTAQIALQRSLALAVMLNRRLPLGMRRKMRKRDLLREEQHENAGQMEIKALHETGLAPSAISKCNLNHSITDCNQRSCSPQAIPGSGARVPMHEPECVATMIMASIGMARSA